ncbi:YecA family protein [Alcanivorax sp. JB21]|uniref:YecA/YgfB family protein n=1 Tax=Alcanivorax limicola TaxID=2874102 RepID=UPI001CBE8408|nr:YecA family protein [Alcanivorax limicola]MBZ2187793.1 YecA family protein [Alcanivorax limicola]
MESLENPGLRQTVDAFIRETGEDALTWTEIHGLMCAISAGPSAPEDWPQICHAEENAVPANVATALLQLQQRLAAQLGVGERLQLPCLLDPYADDEGEDLSSWCAGFMAGVLLQEERWSEADEERMANMLLPFLLISGMDEDPELDSLWEDTRLVRTMAMAIPELLEELFLYFHAPDAPTGGDDSEASEDD